MNNHPRVGVGVIVMRDGKVLMGKRKNAHGEGSWAFPGGHLEYGESFDDCAKREVMEETGLEVVLGRPFYVGEWRPVVKGEPWQVVATFFECQVDTTAVQLSEDHDDYRWIDPKNYQDFNHIPNLVPAFKAYLKK